MITIYIKNKVSIYGNEREIEIRCLSIDIKPTTIDDKEIINGTNLIEMDTGKTYYYDEGNHQWIEYIEPSNLTIDVRTFIEDSDGYLKGDPAEATFWYNKIMSIKDGGSLDMYIIDENGVKHSCSLEYESDSSEGIIYAVANAYYKESQSYWHIVPYKDSSIAMEYVNN